MAQKRRASSSSARRKIRMPRHRLCSQCSEVDFDAMLSSPAPGTSPYAETFTINPRAAISDSSCVFCDFLAAMGPFDSSADGHVQLHLSYAGIDNFPLLSRSGVNVVKVRCHNSFSSNRYFASQSDPRIPIRTVEPGSIDYGIVQKWLQTCQDLHPDRCKPPNVNVSNLQLIDCETRTIVPALNREYVTLSYLWGTNETETPFTGRLIPQLPRTIEDALLVTQNLGFRYLWIDRYCINQHDKAETSAQLQAMGSIYRNSQLTIIAAAGHDPSYGLPGVGKQHRRPLPSTQINGMYLRAIRRIDQVVTPSRWNSRGWTYQEGILATRRLVLTDEQVYFECHGMCCYETFDLPYANMHLPGVQAFKSWYHTTPPGKTGGRVGMFPAAHDANAGDIYIHIARYSNRNLSHDEDRLKAFLGILEAFQGSLYRVRHHWGVPILHFEHASEFSLTSFVFGLMWGHKFRDANVRILGLPTWSWAGMLGSVEFDYQLGDETVLFLTTLLDDVQVELELQSGDLISWEDFQANYLALKVDGIGMGLSPNIHISAWSAPAQTKPLLVPDVGSEETRFLDQYRTLSIDMIDGSSISHEVFMPDVGECEVLVLGRARGEVFMLVVQKIAAAEDREGDVYERVQRLFQASDEHTGVSRWCVTDIDGQERRFEYRDPETHDLPRKTWGEEWWRSMKGGSVKTFRLG
ncbi:HET-domain-containing protein [Cadophora sp. DSE1049]|nr:HET-domain-containing protein [Cadophora sp. DSE1049]